MVDETEVNTFNSQSSSLIKLNNGTVLYLREVNKFLALVCILREENFQKQGMLLCKSKLLYLSEDPMGYI